MRGDARAADAQRPAGARACRVHAVSDADLAAIVAFIHDQKTKAESLTGGRRARGRRRSADRQRRGRAGGISTARAARSATRRPAISPASATRFRGSRCCSGCSIPAPAAAARPVAPRRSTVTLPSGAGRHGQARLSRRVHDRADRREPAGTARGRSSQVNVHGRRSARGARRSARQIHRRGHARRAARTCRRFDERRAGSVMRGRRRRASALARRARGARRRSGDAAEAAGRQLADLSRRLLRPAAQHARRRSRRRTSTSSRWPGRSRRTRRSRSRRRRSSSTA